MISRTLESWRSLPRLTLREAAAGLTPERNLVKNRRRRRMTASLGK